MKSGYSIYEIIEKLKWFHGEDFKKYPLTDWTIEELLKGKECLDK